jgi:hypothetical protein
MKKNLLEQITAKSIKVNELKQVKSLLTKTARFVNSRCYGYMPFGILYDNKSNWVTETNNLIKGIEIHIDELEKEIADLYEPIIATEQLVHGVRNGDKFKFSLSGNELRTGIVDVLKIVKLKSIVEPQPVPYVWILSENRFMSVDEFEKLQVKPEPLRNGLIERFIKNDLRHE